MSIGIRLIGLGTAPGELTTDARRELEQADEVVLIGDLPPGYDGLSWDVSFHEANNLFPADADSVDVMANRLLKLGIRPDGLVAAFGGDPITGSAIVASLQKKAEGVAVPIRFFPAPGCLQSCLALAGTHAADGLYQIHASRLEERHHPPFSPDMQVFIHDVPEGDALNALIRMLGNQYPHAFRISVFLQEEEGGFRRHEMPLGKVLSFSRKNRLRAMLLPPLKRESGLESFQETVAHLRADDGCPWDREQTHQSLRLHLLEETYEALDALDGDDLHGLAEELGDLLLQIALHAQIATENESFRMTDVIGGIQEKIIRRHPHVFSDEDVQDSSDVLKNWEALKQSERRAEGQEESLLNGVARALPALAQAVEIQSRAARVGFEWPEIEGVLAKIEEETLELKQAENQDERSAEFGDLLFVMANYARWLDIDPETALREACGRFRKRFHKLEDAAAAQGRTLQDMSLEEMDAIWDSAKETG